MPDPHLMFISKEYSAHFWSPWYKKRCWDLRKSGKKSNRNERGLEAKWYDSQLRQGCQTGFLRGPDQHCNSLWACKGRERGGRQDSTVLAKTNNRIVESEWTTRINWSNPLQCAGKPINHPWDVVVQLLHKSLQGWRTHGLHKYDISIVFQIVPSRGFPLYLSII